jgi:hypothetical protein
MSKRGLKLAEGLSDGRLEQIRGRACWERSVCVSDWDTLGQGCHVLGINSSCRLLECYIRGLYEQV